MLSNFAEKKEICFDYKKQNFSKSKKSAFPKGLTHPSGKKKCHFFLYSELVKIRLQIMLNYFEEKKETFFDLKNMNFSNSSKLHFFKWVNPYFWPKNAIFSFI